MFQIPTINIVYPKGDAPMIDQHTTPGIQAEEQALATYSAWLTLQKMRPGKQKLRIWGRPSKEGADIARKNYIAALSEMDDEAFKLFDMMVAEHMAREIG